MSDDRSDLIHQSLDGELDEETRAELEQALSTDPDLARQLASFEELQDDLKSLNEAPDSELTDRIMRSLPDRPGPVPFYRWILQPVRLPAWALGVVCVVLVVGGVWVGRVGGEGTGGDTASATATSTATATATLVSAGAADTCPTPRVMVRFLIKAPEASKVSLAGDFNDWSVEQTLMSDEDGNGIWSVTVPLEPGRYQYKFLLDGKKWVVEPDAPAYQADGFGGKNSLLVI